MSETSPPETISLTDVPAPAGPPTLPPPDTINLDQLHPGEVTYAAKNVQDATLGGTDQHALAALEGVGRGATFGGTDWLETKLGLSTPEAIKARKEYYPGTNIAGNIVGSGLLLGAGGAAIKAATGIAGGLGGLIEAGGVAPVLAHTLGFAGEGAALSAGNLSSDAALGDPNLNGQKVAAELGMGALLGSGAGLFFKGLGALPALLRKAAPAAESAIPGVAEVASEGVAPAVMDAPVVGVKPTSFEDMAKKVEEAVKYGGQTTEIPEYRPFMDALSRVEMNNPVHPLQVESLLSQEARNNYKTARELKPVVAEYEAGQKKELVGKLDKAIDFLSPNQTPVADAVKGGEKAIEAFTDQYQKEKKALAPIFEELNRVDLENNVNHLPGVIEKFTDAVPGVARMFDTSGSAIKIKPYSTGWGIDKATYTAVKQAVDAIEETPGSFRELMNIRDGMSQNVNVLDQGRAPSQIRALKAAMMDYVQDAVQKVAPESEVREAFKRYAINEQERGVIEKAFGASVGNSEFGAISKVKPEMVGDKIFGNTANVKAAKQILEPEKFNEILANWLSELRVKATDNGKFSSNKFNSLLRSNQDALNIAFQDSPQLLQRMKDVTTIMRILPDSASINPSGTAKTLLSGLTSHLAKGGIDPMKQVANAFEAAKGFLEQKRLTAELNAHLAGKADQATQLRSIYTVIKKTTDQINSNAKGIFEKGAKAASLTALTQLSSKEYDEHVEQIKKFSADPEAMIDHLSDHTSEAHAAAPNITQGINNTVMRGVQYLNTQIPKPQNPMLLSPSWQASRSQKASFNKSFQAVNDPVGALKQVKQGTLTNEAMRAIQTVHPDLLMDMRKSVMEHMDLEKAKHLPTAQKAALARFLGQPLDHSQLPQTILSNQKALSGPELSKQTRGKPGQMKDMKIAFRTATRTRGENDNE